MTEKKKTPIISCCIITFFFIKLKHFSYMLLFYFQSLLRVRG